MTQRKSAKALSAATILTVLGGLILSIVVAFVLMGQANFLIGRSLLIAFGNANSTYKAAWFQWNGDVVAKDFVLASDDAQEPAAIRFKRIHLDTPGWSWVLRTISSKQDFPRLDRLHLTLTDSSSDAGVDPSMGDLGPFGTDSASPFEAEGCRKDSIWLRGELLAMGLHPGPTTLDFDYRVKGDLLDTTVTLDTPAVSTARMDRSEQLPGPVNPLMLDQVPTVATAERWTVLDHGFIKARNAYCAAKDGATVDEFVTRHVDTIERLLAIVGAKPDPESLAVYADFVRNGGQISYGGKYLESTAGVADNAGAFASMDGMLERGGQRRTVQWTRLPPRPLAGLEHDLASFAALEQERASGIDLAPAGATAMPLSTARVVRTDSDSKAHDPASLQRANALQASTTSVSVPAAAKASASASATANATAGAAPAASPPASVARAHRGSVLAWEELHNYRGRLLEISTLHNPPQLMTVSVVSPAELTVQAHVGGGRADYRISRDAFVRAVLME